MFVKMLRHRGRIGQPHFSFQVGETPLEKFRGILSILQRNAHNRRNAAARPGRVNHLASRAVDAEIKGPAQNEHGNGLFPDFALEIFYHGRQLIALGDVFYGLQCQTFHCPDRIAAADAQRFRGNMPGEIRIGEDIRVKGRPFRGLGHLFRNLFMQIRSNHRKVPPDRWGQIRR